MGAMVEAARGTDLAVTAVRDIGPDYALTLRAWRKSWNERKADILALRYSEKFWLKVRAAWLLCGRGVIAEFFELPPGYTPPVTRPPNPQQTAPDMLLSLYTYRVFAELRQLCLW